MQKALDNLVKDAQREIDGADDLASLDKIRVQYLGKKGTITKQMQSLGKLAQEDRRDAGKIINDAKVCGSNKWLESLKSYRTFWLKGQRNKKI